MVVGSADQGAELAVDLGAELMDAARQWHGSQWRIVWLAGEIEQSDVWTFESSTAANWIAEVVDVCPATAREWVRIGRALRDLPVVSTAFERHDISYSKVRTLTRVATSENEAELLDIARLTPAAKLAVELARHLHGTETPEKRRQRHTEQRSFRTWTEPDGMVCGFFRLPALDAAFVTAGVDAKMMENSRRVRSLNADRGKNASAVASSRDRWPSVAQQRADALVDAMRSPSTGQGTVRPEIVFHVRGDGCSLDDGTPIDPGELAAIAPESFIRVLVHDAERRPIDASSKQRHPTARQKRVVKARDQVCVDCGSHDLLEYDHDPAFEITERTVVAELKLRCANCHHRRHRRAA